MGRIERFEDLIAWQKARELTLAVYRMTRQAAFREDFDLVRQVRRAAVSAMSNVAEGFERNRPTEFHQFLSTAKSSCGEVRSQLYVALDAGFINDTLFAELYARSTELGRIINGLRAAVARQKTKDTQHSGLSTQDSELRS